MVLHNASVCRVYIYICLQQISLYLLQNRPDDFQWQRTKLVLFEEVIEVLLQHLKHQAGVAAVLKAF